MLGKPQKVSRLKPWHAMIVAIIALILAVTGNSVASQLFSGHKIENHTIGYNKLTPGLQNKINAASAGVSIGAPGPTGKEGSAGKNGSDGADGKAGNSGSEGPAGPQGPAGQQGPEGMQGSEGPAGKDAVTRVTALGGVWEAHSGTDGGPTPAYAPVFTSNGLQFGPFSDGQQYAGVNFNGLQGKRLKDLVAVDYVASYTQQGVDEHGGEPYLRFITYPYGEPNEVNHVTFTPNTQADSAAVKSGRTVEWEVLKGTVRYNDDAGEFPDDVSWNTLIEEHGDEVIKAINIQAGDNGDYSQGTTALVKSLFVNVAGTPAMLYEFTREGPYGN